MLPAWPRALRVGMTVQAAGALLLGAAGAAVLLGGHAVGGAFSGEIGPAVGVDPLSGAFLVVIGVVGAPACLFARGYLVPDRAGRAVGALTGPFLLALASVVVARDATTFLGGWELMTAIPAAAVLIARRQPAVRRTVFEYLAITHLGGVGVWLALLLAAEQGSLGGTSGPGGATRAALLALALVGFGTKAGLVPFHAWLPRTHPVAPAHLSALMSGVMTTVAVYGLVRTLRDWAGPPSEAAGLALLALGAVSALGGALWAAVQRDLKRLLAFSTIENIGIVAAALGAWLVLAAHGENGWAAIALGAALLHAIVHAVAKGLLFLGAGALERAVGDLALDRLGGLLRRLPWSGGAMLAGLIALAGVPPLAGFVSEWLVLRSVLEVPLSGPLGPALAGALVVAALAAAAALGAYAAVAVAGLVLLGPPRRPECAEASEAAAPMRSALLALAGIVLALGAAPGVPVDVLADLAPGGLEGAGVAGLVVPGTGRLPALALAGALVAVALVARLLRGTPAPPAPVWVCGQARSPRLGWTAAGFTKPLRLTLDALLRPAREVEVIAAGGLVQEVRHRAEVPHPVEAYVYRPVARAALAAAEVARRIQSGSLRAYVAWLIGLVLALLVAVRLWGGA